ncbi:penicillin acylase family protein [Xanthomonas sp. NCPPB 2654]|uniref:penicillin acylase family protein n=1 Tax=unclassified Xanthomonas TaxID=2643310 RepID=UPI0021DFC3F1|nr:MULTISPECIES: penicillin acylase family protein [unclassified Xanthomonas]MDL5364779.1 penicillin acylase family protein [Xanthomonas sp. NCPPB 2654]UYC18807.1 penicillin acylase family protein [Xanthomonas sp. CFBP 8443]
MTPRSFPLATRLVALVVLPLLAGAGWLFFSLHASLPADGTLRLEHGVSAPVAIARDPNGVPHIRADSDTDAFFAIGYVHAQDRLWQLELQRRMARGRLSEIFGKASIETDVWFRTLGLYDSAKSAWPALSPEAQRSLTAYSAGINAWIAEKHPLPPEFRALGVTPAPWTELDSLAWIKVFALDLGGNFRREIDRYVASQTLTDAQLAAFFPSYPADAPTTAAAFPPTSHDAQRLLALAAFQRGLESAYALGGRNVGSNAWAVAGRHSKDGMALLANDPHLGLQIPSLWYVVSVDAPTYKVSGMSLVGLPVTVLGRNAHIAWGGTNMMADAQDLFLERPDRSGERYEINGAWQPFQTRTETLQVRADFPQQLRKQYAPVTLKVRQTRHGPIISDYYGVFDQPVALRWTALDPGDTSYEAFFRLNYATDWKSFKAALASHVAPAMNILYIDRGGNIGYLGAGRIPIRKQGQGTLPSPGWDDSHDWSGHIPEAAWPQSYNPPSGYIVNANNKIVGNDYPYLISHDWASPARARRIEQLLRQRTDAGKLLTVGDMQRIQADTTDLDAAELMAELKHRLPQGEHGAQAAAYLKTWNGDMRADSQAAAIFTVWMLHFRQRVFSNELHGTWNNQQASKILRSLQSEVSLAYLREMLQRNDPAWCDDSATSARKTCDAELAAAQNSALWELYKLKGDWSMASWRWGEIQSTVYTHLPFSQWKPLDKVFERRIGNGGSENTINVASSEFAGADGYLQKFGAGFRQVVALRGVHAEHYYMNSTGQSGNALSPHYDDMVEPFRDVRYQTLDSTFDKGRTSDAL